MKNTTDVWFASYLMLIGVDLATYEVISKGKGRYYFDVEEDDWKLHKMRFHQSDVTRVKMLQISLRDLVH